MSTIRREPEKRYRHAEGPFAGHDVRCARAARATGLPITELPACNCGGPATPSTRVTEAELLEWEASTAAFGPIVYGGQPGDPEVVGMFKAIEERQRLVAEIRRYRAMLIGLADGSISTDPTAWARGWGAPCRKCGADPGQPHRPHEFGAEYSTDGRNHYDADAVPCPWPELEAEVQAIRAERGR